MGAILNGQYVFGGYLKSGTSVVDYQHFFVYNGQYAGEFPYAQKLATAVSSPLKLNTPLDKLKNGIQVTMTKQIRGIISSSGGYEADYQDLGTNDYYFSFIKPIKNVVQIPKKDFDKTIQLIDMSGSNVVPLTISVDAANQTIAFNPHTSDHDTANSSLVFDSGTPGCCWVVIDSIEAY